MTNQTVKIMPNQVRIENITEKWILSIYIQKKKKRKREQSQAKKKRQKKRNGQWLIEYIYVYIAIEVIYGDGILWIFFFYYNMYLLIKLSSLDL